jgi:hypothetical protein
MKVLYVGPYRQNGFDGTLSRCYVNTLLETGLDITIRPVYTSHMIDNGVDHRFLQAEYNNKNKTFDVVIQHVLPHSYEYNSKCGKHIGIYPAETRNHQFISWPYRANLLDEIWVTNDAEKGNVEHDNVIEVPLKVVTPGINTAKYGEPLQPFDNDIDDRFVFYYSGPIDQKFQVEKALVAFHSEFDPSESVVFLLHVNEAQHPQKNAEDANNLINKVKSGLRLYPQVGDYIQDAVIPEPMDEASQQRLHSLGDCLVFLPVGSQMNIFSLDAIGYGNQIITTEGFGTVKYNYESLFEMKSELADLYTGREYGKSVVISDLREKMREAFNKGKTKEMVDLSWLGYQERAKELKKALGVNE